MMNGHYEWKGDHLTMLSSSITKTVETALQQGPVFARHLGWHTGSGARFIAFQTLDQFHQDLSLLEPGDTYWIWSIPRLVKEGLCLAHLTNLGQGLSSSATSARVVGSLEDGSEILAAFFSGSLSPQACADDTYGGLTELIEYYERVGYSEIYLFTLTVIDKENHYLIHARFPNSNGEIPVWEAE
jgi:hypothetical protein